MKSNAKHERNTALYYAILIGTAILIAVSMKFEVVRNMDSFYFAIIVTAILVIVAHYGYKILIKPLPQYKTYITGFMRPDKYVTFSRHVSDKLRYIGLTDSFDVERDSESMRYTISYNGASEDILECRKTLAWIEDIAEVYNEKE